MKKAKIQAKPSQSAASADSATAPGRRSGVESLQMKPMVQAEPGGGQGTGGGGTGAAAPTNAAPPSAGAQAAPAASDGLVDKMVQAMGYPALPKKPEKRERALLKLGMTPQDAAKQASEMFAPQATAGPAMPGAASTQAKLQAKGEPAARDVDVSNSGGSPINPALAQAMGGAIGHDFSNVTLHQDGQAEGIGAHAFTTGNHVHFAQGKLDTSSSDGLALLGHELTHVKQQADSRVAVPSQSKPASGNSVNVQDPTLEREADVVGARAAAAVGPSVTGISPTASGGGAASAGEAAQMKPSGASMVSSGGVGTVQAKGIVQCEPVTLATTTLFTIAGTAVTVGEAATVAAALVSSGTMAVQQASASLATANRAGPDLRLPSSEGGLYAASDSGKNLIAGMIQMLSAKALKRVAADAAAKKEGDEAAKEAAARDAVSAQKENAKSNASTEVSNALQLGANQDHDESFVWNDQNGWSEDPTYGKVRLRAQGGCLYPFAVGIRDADWADFNITKPLGNGADFFRRVTMSATSDDSTVEWWDYLEVMPTVLTFVDDGAGRLHAEGEATFGWEDSITKMKWDASNYIGVFGIMPPNRENTPND